MPEVEAATLVEAGIKRVADEYGEFEDQASKVSKFDHTEVRLLLLGRDCGGIIGKGGENISRFRTTYNVNFRIPSSQTLDRVASINGSMENCMAIVKEIMGHTTKVPYSTNQDCPVEVNFLVQTNVIGSILGKGGARITEIRESTNAKVKVYEECLPNSNERVIAIGGDNDEQVSLTMVKILNILKEVPTRSRPQYYDPSYNPGGIIMPNKKLGGNVNRSASNFQNAWGNEGNGLMAGGFPMTGPLRNGVQPLMGMGNDVTNNSEHSSRSFLHLQTETNISAPNDMVGAIIGKGGLRIREIREGSRAKITFSESDKDSKVDRIITLTGTQEQVQTAEHMITQYLCNLGT